MSSPDFERKSLTGVSKFPLPAIAVCHFIVSEDIERSRRFYTEILGGEAVHTGEPTYVALGNSWIIINLGGGPTEDKPTITLETPRDDQARAGPRRRRRAGHIIQFSSVGGRQGSPALGAYQLSEFAAGGSPRSRPRRSHHSASGS